MSLPTEGLFDLLSPARREVLAAIAQKGDATVADLSTALGLSASALRQTLAGLVGAGLISVTEVRHGVGRPAKHYRVTRRAEELLNPFDGILLPMLEAALAVVGSDQPLDREAWGRRLAESCDPGGDEGGSPPADYRTRLAQVQKVLAGWGNAPAIRRDEAGPVLVLESCPVLSIARRHPGLCDVERICISELLHAPVPDRGRWRLDGGSSCSYRLGCAPERIDGLPRP